MGPIATQNGHADDVSRRRSHIACSAFLVEMYGALDSHSQKMRVDGVGVEDRLRIRGARNAVHTPVRDMSWTRHQSCVVRGLTTHVPQEHKTTLGGNYFQTVRDTHDCCYRCVAHLKLPLRCSSLHTTRSCRCRPTHSTKRKGRSAGPPRWGLLRALPFAETLNPEPQTLNPNP